MQFWQFPVSRKLLQRRAILLILSYILFILFILLWDELYNQWNGAGPKMIIIYSQYSYILIVPVPMEGDSYWLKTSQPFPIQETIQTNSVELSKVTYIKYFCIARHGTQYTLIFKFMYAVVCSKAMLPNHRTLPPKAIYFRLSSLLFYYLNKVSKSSVNKVNWTELIYFFPIRKRRWECKVYSHSTSRVTGIFEIWTEFWNLHVRVNP